MSGHEEGPAERAWRGPEEHRERQLVLVIEDEPEDWEIYGRMLWYNGFDVLHAATAEEGLALARRHVPSLIILDLMLPDMDGLEVCGALRQGPTAGIPILMLSGRPEAEFGQLAIDAGCRRYLEKPISPVTVLHEVEAVIGAAPSPG